MTREWYEEETKPNPGREALRSHAGDRVKQKLDAATCPALKALGIAILDAVLPAWPGIEGVDRPGWPGSPQ